MIVRRQPDWLTASVSGDVILMSRKRRSHFILNRIGARIWHILETPRTVHEICDALMEEFEITAEFCRDEVRKFLDELGKAGVILRDGAFQDQEQIGRAPSVRSDAAAAATGHADTPNLLDFRIGNATVAENMERALQIGRLIALDDGKLKIPDMRAANENFAYVANVPPPDCDFLMYFLFRGAYDKGAVPLGCSQCYKVKVVPKDLRGLVAGLEMAKSIQCYSKWGIDLDNIYSQSTYAGYFYVSGINMARLIFKIVREAIDADPRLGPDVSVAIKRGCSDYEAELGPSSDYEFAPELAEIEAYLKTRFQPHTAGRQSLPPLAHWIDTAFRIGDDTYLDFTAGQALRGKSVTYAP